MKKLLSMVISIILIVSSFSAFSIGNTDMVFADEGFNLYATAGDGVVKLWWDEVPNAKQGYYLYRGETSGGQYLMPLTDFGILGNVYFDKNVENGRNYCYYAVALDDDASSFLKSNEVCVSVLEDLPTLIEPCKLVLTFTIDSAEYMVNGVKKMMSTPCIIDNNRAFLLIRYVAEAVGAEVLWDGIERKVTVVYKGKTIEMWIGKSVAKVNGVESPIDPNNPRVVPFIKNGRTHIPLRFPVESFGEGEVKWYAATKQAVLSFPDRCEETVEGLLVRYSDSTGLGHLKAFTGESYLLANMNSLADGFKPFVGDCLKVTGRNDHEDYPGYLYVSTAEIIECPYDGIKNWEGKVTELDCAKGEIHFTDFDGDSQMVLLPTDNKNLVSFCGRLQIGDCFRVSGKQIESNNGLYIVPENIETMDCPGETDEFECDGDWFSGKIIEIDCIGNSLKVELDGGDLVTVTLPKNINCMEMSDTWCVRICGDRISTDKISAKIVVAKPCSDDSCNGEKFVGKVLSLSEVAGILKLSHGDTYIEFDISGLPIDKSLNEMNCAEVCAYKVINSEIATNVSYKWVALSVKKSDCSRICDGRIIEARIERILSDCSKMLIFDLGLGKSYEIEIGQRNLCNLKIGQCYELCVVTEANNLSVTSAKKIDCPISCDGLQVFGVLKKVTSFDATIQLYGSERKYSFSISETQAKKLEENMCIEACIKFELSGSASLSWFAELEPDECGITEEQGCDGVELIVHIKEVDCDNNSMKIKIIDGHSMIKGMEMELPIDESIIKCSELENDSCAKVCGRIVGFTDFELIWWEKIDPELCGIEEPPAEETCDEDVIGRIVYLGCREDDKIIIDVDGVEETYISKDVSVCNGFKIGDCVSACLKVIPGIPPVVLSMEKLEDEKCPEVEPECDRNIKINIQNVYCDEGYIEGMEVLTVEARTPMPLKIHFNRTDFCEMKAGNCYEICVYTDENGRYHGQNFMLINCTVGFTCGGRMVDVKIIKKNPENMTLIYRLDGEIKQISVKPDIFESVSAGMCLRLCIDTDDEGSDVILDYREIQEKICDDDKCVSGRRFFGKIIAVESKDDLNGALIMLYGYSEPMYYELPSVPGWIPFDEDDCVELCVRFDPKSGYLKIEDFSFMPEDMCGYYCSDGNLWRGSIYDVDAERGIITLQKGVSLWALKVAPNLCKRFKIGDCVVACGQWQLENQIFVTTWIRKLPRMLCSNQCEGQVVEGEIVDLDPEQMKLVIDVSGKVIDVKTNLEITDLKPELCLRICITELLDDEKMFSSSWFEVVPCETEKTCEDDLIHAVVAEDFGELMVWVDGNRYEVLGVENEIAYKSGTCIEICGKFSQENTGVTSSTPIVINANWIRVLPDEECENKTDIWVCVTYEINDDQTGVVDYRGGKYEIHFPDDVSEKLNVGDCIKIIGTYVKKRQLFICDKLTILSEEECEACKVESVKASLIHLNIDEKVGYILQDGLIRKILFESHSVFEGYLHRIPKLIYPICVELCGEVNPFDNILFVTSMKLISQSECIGECGGLVYKGIVEEIDHDSGRMKLEHSKDRGEDFYYPDYFRIPKYINFELGRCVRVCTQPITITDTMVDMEWYPLVVWGDYLPIELCIVEEEPEPEPEPELEGQTWEGVVSRTYCVEDLLYCEIDGTTFMVGVPEDIKCESFVVGDCVEITGVYDEKYQIITALKIEKIACPENVETWDMVIFGTYCRDTKEPYYLARDGMLFYKVYLPENLKCETFKVGACITVEGVMKSSQRSEIGTSGESYIIAKRVSLRKCVSSGPYDAVVSSTDCDLWFMKVNYESSEYVLFYPSSFNCSSLEKGDCIRFYGRIQSGYLEADTIEKVDCPKEEETHTLFITSVNAKTGIITGLEKTTTYNIEVVKPFSISNYKIGECITATGTVSVPKGILGVAPTITPSKLTKARCPAENEFTVKVTDKKCLVIGGVPYLEVAYYRKTYKLFFTSKYNCEDFVVNQNYDVVGYTNTKEKYIHATVVTAQIGTPIPALNFGLEDYSFSSFE